jgi:HK97 family phage prohead protease
MTDFEYGARYIVGDDGVAVKISSSGASHDILIQGKAADFNKPFQNGDEVWMLQAGCFDKSLDSSRDVKIFLNHDSEHCLGSRNNNRLQIHAGEESMIFRFLLPVDSKGVSFAEFADDLESYLGVSIGFAATKYDKAVIDGIEVKTITEGELQEISLTNRKPAISTTFARFVSWQKCSPNLEDDYDLINLAGRVISIHRKAQADGGEIKYAHTPSPYDRAANSFLRTLEKLQ